VYNQLVDIWGIGVYIYEILTGWTFVRAHHRTKEACLVTIDNKVKTMNEPRRDTNLVWDLLSQMSCPRSERLTAAEVLNHNYFSDIPNIHITSHHGRCYISEVPIVIVKMVDSYQKKYNFPNNVWGLAIHLLQQIYASKKPSRKRTIH